MKDSQRDQLRKCILELLAKGFVHYTDIEKKAIGTCQPFITSNTFRRQFYGYLLAHGYIERVARGVYGLTKRGRNYLVLLTQ